MKFTTAFLSAVMCLGSFSQATNLRRLQQGAPSLTTDDITVTWVPQGDSIEFTMVAAVEGYVSMCVSPQATGGHSTTCDSVLGYVVGDAATLIDGAGSGGTGPHVTDPTQNITPGESSQVNGVTTIKFTRPLAAAEAADQTIVAGDMYMSWAVSNGDDATTIHTARGGDVLVNLAAASPGGGGGAPGGGGGGAAQPVVAIDDGTFTASYTVDTVAQEIEFSIQGTLPGWISLAFSETGAGHNAPCDSFVGWVGADGTAVGIDGNAKTGDGFAPHNQDLTQSFTDVTGTVQDGKTTMTFKRKFTTGDADDLDFTDAEISLIYAYGEAPGTGAVYGQHPGGGYGKAKVNLLAAGAGTGGGGTGGPANGGTPPGGAQNGGGGGVPGGDNTIMYAAIGGGGVVALAVGGFVYQKRSNRNSMRNAPPVGAKPAGMMTPSAGGGGGGSDWRATQDPSSGKTYYYNSKTGEVSWSAPMGL